MLRLTRSRSSTSLHPSHFSSIRSLPSVRYTLWTGYRVLPTACACGARASVILMVPCLHESSELYRAF